MNVKEKLKSKENQAFLIPIIFLAISIILSSQTKTITFTEFIMGVFFGMALALFIVLILFKLQKKKKTDL